MRIRTIKPEFWSHPVMSRMSTHAKLMAIGLLNVADDHGYFLASSPYIRAQLFPFDDQSSNVRGSLDELVRVGYIEVNTSQEYGPVGRVVNFSKHQRVDKPSPSKIKTYFDSSNDRRTFDERSTLEQGTGNREHVSLAATPKPPCDTPKASAQPQRDGELRFEELQAEKPVEKSAKPRQRDECFEALAEIEGGHAGLTVTARGMTNKALREIRQACPDVTPDEIRRRVRMYRLHFPSAVISALAVSKHWARCERPPAGAAPHTTPQGNPTYTSDLLKAVDKAVGAQ